MSYRWEYADRFTVGIGCGFGILHAPGVRRHLESPSFDIRSPISETFILPDVDFKVGYHF